MPDPQLVLAARVQDALSAAFGPSYADADPVIRPSQFADLQANVALPLAKKLGRKPRDVADEIVKHLDVAGVVSDVQVSGPGCINLTLSDAWIAGEAQRALEDARLGVPATGAPQQPHAEGMKSGYVGRRIERHILQQRCHPLPHLVRSFVRERDRQYGGRGHMPRRNDVRDTMRDDSGFAAAGARKDEQGPLGMGHGFTLLSVQAFEKVHERERFSV